MQFIKSEDYKKGSNDLAFRIITELRQGKKVLWIVTGGSSTFSSVEALRLIRESGVATENLTVTLTDERYGEVGHKDSCWQKLLDDGFLLDALSIIPVLRGMSFEETAEEWEREMQKAFKENDFIVAQFGIGSDLHLAGILPESSSARALGLVSFYDASNFKRITLTFEAIRKIQEAYVFIFGESKRGVIRELKESEDSLFLKPVNILKSLPCVFVYSDSL